MSILTLALVVAAVPPQDIPVLTVRLATSALSTGDRFGSALSTDGGSIAIGASFDSEVVGAGGAIYLIDLATAAIERKITIPGAGFLDQLGRSVALSGNLVLGCGDEFGCGDAHVFDRSTGVELLQLAATTQGICQDYGYSADMHGNRAVVGDRFWRVDFADSNAYGAAWLFDPTTGAQIAQLSITNSSDVEWLGEDLALSSTRCVAGAPRSDLDGNDSGRAYLFDSSDGSLIATLQSPQPTASGLFGQRVAASELWVAVAEVGADTFGAFSGAVHLFDAGGGAFVRTFYAPDALPGDGFAADVAISGDRIAIGASRRNGEEGSVYIFDVNTGSHLHTLVEQNPYFRAWFGSNLAFEGDHLVHADLRDDTFLDDAGSARIVELPMTLSASPSTVSLSGGGSQTLTVTSGPSEAGNIYVFVGSITGTSPGTLVGSATSGLLRPLVPLNLDTYTMFTLNTLGSNDPIMNQVGLFDANGSASATFFLPPGSSSTLLPYTVHHACIAIDPTPWIGVGHIDRASTAAQLNFTP